MFCFILPRYQKQPLRSTETILFAKQILISQEFVEQIRYQFSKWIIFTFIFNNIEQTDISSKKIPPFEQVDFLTICLSGCFSTTEIFINIAKPIRFLNNNVCCFFLLWYFALIVFFTWYALAIHVKKSLASYIANFFTDH